MVGINRKGFSRGPAIRGGIHRLGAMLLPGSAAGRMLAISAGIDSLGTGLFFASFTLYFVGIVKIGAPQVALASTAAGILALFVPVPLGRLADRLGPGRLYIGLLVLRGLGYCCYAGVSGFKGFLVLTMVLTAADRASTPLQQSVVRALIGNQDGTRTMASIRGVRNVGLTAGFLVAAAAFATAAMSVFTVLFVANGVSFLVAAAMVWPTVSRTEAVAAPAPATAPTAGPTAGAAACPRSPFRDRWFVVFTIGNGVLWLHDSVLIVLLPIWVIKHTAVPAGWVPVFMAVNTVLTAVLQVYVARFANGAVAANRVLGLAGLLLRLLGYRPGRTHRHRGRGGADGGHPALGRRKSPQRCRLRTVRRAVTRGGLEPLPGRLQPCLHRSTGHRSCRDGRADAGGADRLAAAGGGLRRRRCGLARCCRPLPGRAGRSGVAPAGWCASVLPRVAVRGVPGVAASTRASHLRHLA